MPHKNRKPAWWVLQKKVVARRQFVYCSFLLSPLHLPTTLNPRGRVMFEHGYTFNILLEAETPGSKVVAIKTFSFLALSFFSPLVSFLLATLFIGSSSAVIFVQAIPTNITIDDTSSAFIFGSGWVASPCSYCSAQLNQSLTYNGTWHDGGARTGLSGQLKFDGTAVYLFGVTSQDDTGAIDFTIDGQSIAPFDSSSSSSVPEVVHIYNFSLLALIGLNNGSHTLGFTTILAANSSQTVLIDYAVVTFDNSTVSSPESKSDSEPSSSSSNGFSKSVLIGGVVGGVIGAVVLLLCAFFFIRARQERKGRILAQSQNNVYPFQATMTMSNAESFLERGYLGFQSSNFKERLAISGILPTDSMLRALHRSRSSQTDVTDNSQIDTSVTGATNSNKLSNAALSQHIQVIQKMEQLIQSFETLVLLRCSVLASATASPEAPPPYYCTASIPSTDGLGDD
ncbi:hypothetical protein D9757_009942 [Collybiopsis confluens]|uniref:Uncharacterized protein n=1 Tax=Collybiopsis confluens TaxID=2823264 RepID=A0A8H5LZP5_9AGAR|nr:hypothetical protein D9757_009942 [Collybiopsis confluens]